MSLLPFIPSAPDELIRAKTLLGEIKRCVSSGALRKEFDEQLRLSLGLDQSSDQHEAEALLDWFTFEWCDDEGRGVIDRFVESARGLTQDNRELALDWLDSISGVFEMKVVTRSAVRLRELETGELYEVDPESSSELSMLKRGQFICARILPLGDRFIFSYPPLLMPNRSAAVATAEVSRILNSLNSPEMQQQILEEVREVFCEYFGSDEVTVAPGALSETVEGFLRYMFFVRVDPETDATMAETFKTEFNEDLWLPVMGPVPTQVLNPSEVTIICDEFEGIVFLPEYALFKRIFETPNPAAAAPNWRDIVSAYIKDPCLPAIAFERVTEKHPKRVEKIMRELLEDDDFSIDHLYCALLHFKEPAEGFDNLKDDEKLWDLFDGQKNGSKNVKAPAVSSKVKPGRGGKSKRARTGALKAAPALKPAPTKNSKRPRSRPVTTASIGNARKKAKARS